MGVLGQESEMIPVTVKVRSLGESNAVQNEKDFHFNVFVQQKWTPYLMMLTLFNSISGLNEFTEEATYRLTGKVELDGDSNISLSTMQASGEMPMPAPMMLAGWWGDKFNRLYLNAVKTPELKRVNATVDLLPERRVATIENAWVANSEVRGRRRSAGQGFPAPLSRRAHRARVQAEDPGRALAKGEHRILLSDADTANRMQSMAGIDEPLHRPAGDGFAASTRSAATTSSTSRCCRRAPPRITTTRRCPACPPPC